MNRLRKLLESIAYAGLKPDAPAHRERLHWLGPLAGPITRFLDGGAAPSDPLYLTNRTLGQKLRQAMVIAAPCLLVGAAISLAVLGYFDNPNAAPPPPTLTPAQVAAKMLPNLDKDLKIEVNRDVEVAEVHIEHGAVTKVAGLARNNTDRVIQDSELIFDLTDAAGSRLGAVSARVPRIEAKSTAPFSFSVNQTKAAYALVREIRQP
ncbi:MAG TPA: FxLYD domain-containing protein [Candidatus Sulfopaludibacter sp.]|nr:FxLYD domain-containing protein [Candidatus Sulfopaludibacter sp.]